jgi:hypothetical protein
VKQNNHLPVIDAAQRDATKIADPNIDGHPHSMDGTPQNDAFAV